MPLQHPSGKGKSKTSKPTGSYSAFNYKTYKPKGKKQSSSFKSAVLSVIKSQAETKQAWTKLVPTDFNSAMSGVGDCCQIIPSINNGTGDNARVGDQITPQSLTIRGIIQELPQDPAQSLSVRKIGVRVMIVTPKVYSTWASATANASTWQAYLLKKGGTTVGFTGVIDDLFAPVNTDAITCHYNKVFKFTQNGFYNTASTSITTIDMSSSVRFFKKTFKFGKNRKFKYDASVDTGLTPSAGPAMVMMVGYVFLDGTSPDTLSTRVRVQYDSILNYEDA